MLDAATSPECNENQGDPHLHSALSKFENGNMTWFCSMVLAIRQKYIEHIYNFRSRTNLLVPDVYLLPPRAALEQDSRWEPEEATERRVASSNVAICVMTGCLGV